MPILTIPNKQYSVSDACIICLRAYDADTVNPTLEHIIPEALCKLGEVTIKDGTCADCNNGMNVRFENIALQNDLLVPRMLLELKRKRRSRSSRKPKKLPPVALGYFAKRPIAEDFNLDLSLEQYPKSFGLIMFQPAGRLVGIERSADIFEPSICTVVLDPTGKEIGAATRHRHHNPSYALLLAKIAYCFAAVEAGMDAFDGSEMRSLLQGERDDVYNFVGGAIREEKLTDRFLHRLYLRDRDGLMTVLVHLFASCGMPPYEVVVGRKNHP